jgi:PAS domain S-box-containing protein
MEAESKTGKTERVSYQELKINLNRKSSELKEREKELSCLYNFSKLINVPEISLEEIFSKTVSLIPPSLQHPEITCARIIFQNKEYRTDRFQKTRWMLSEPIKIDGKIYGAIEVFYLKEKPARKEVPFLEGEKYLLDSLSEILAEVITHKKADAVLQKSEERFRLIVETAPSLLLITDKNGKNVYVSPNCLQITGYTRDELEGNTIWWVHEDDDQKARGIFKHSYNKRKNRQNFEYKAVRKNGEVWYASSSWVPHIDCDGKFQGFIMQTIDITERKKTEKKMQRYQRKLRSLALELSLAEERERRRIASDLHSYLSQDLAIASMKLDQVMDTVHSADVAGNLNTIRTVINKAIRSTRSLIFQISPPLLYEVGLEAAIEYLTAHLGEKHEIDFIFHDDTKQKVMDEKTRILLFSCVRELLINVIKHSGAKNVKVLTQKHGNTIQIAIEDDGKGFVVSHTILPQNKNHGFGLFSIRERLNLMGGYLKIKSEIDKGTRVILGAPLMQKTNARDTHYEHKNNDRR